MRLIELTDDGGALMRIIRRQRAAEEQRVGLHVSTICDDYLKTLDAKRYAKEINQTSVFAFQEIGNALEDAIQRELRRRVRGWRKPLPRRDARSVIGSPDGYSARLRRIDEVKATWVSEGTEERNPFVVIGRKGELVEESLKFQRYRMQATHYAYMWGATSIRLHILFINGNYRPPFPNFRTITVRLTPEDKRHNAFLLWQHAEDRGWLKRQGNRWLTFPPQRKAA